MIGLCFDISVAYRNFLLRASETFIAYVDKASVTEKVK
jgi:hypothetical protein